MSVKSELEELVKWINELSTVPPPEDTDDVDRKTWQAVRKYLKRAADKLAKTRDALLAAPQASGAKWWQPRRRREDRSRRRSRGVVAELAGDVHAQTDALVLRAERLSHRAKPGRRERRPERREPDKTKAPGKATAQERDATPPGSKPPSENPPPPASPDLANSADTTIETADGKTPGQLADSAGTTIETAYGKLAEVADPDAETKAFVEELDLLGEMVLGLRERCTALEHEHDGAA